MREEWHVSRISAPNICSLWKTALAKNVHHIKREILCENKKIALIRLMRIALRLGLKPNQELSITLNRKTNQIIGLALRRLC